MHVTKKNSFLKYQLTTFAGAGPLPISSLMKAVKPKCVRGPRYKTLEFDDLYSSILGFSKSNINRLSPVPVMIYEMICTIKLRFIEEPIHLRRI